MSANVIHPGAQIPGPGYYVLESLAGKGGMGEVWRATDTRFGRPVALKFLSADEGWGAQGRARFQLEARAASALNHPNIMTVFDSGEFHHVPYLVTEWISGGTLRDSLCDGPLESSKVAEIGRQALLGLQAAHQASILHRDVKPENLMLREDGFLKILDFGMAQVGEQVETDRLTAHGQVLGTLQYMSPEQLRGEPLDARSDLFSLGLVLYELAAGRPAFTGPPNVILAAILMGEMPNLESLPQDLRPLLAGALEKDREKRFGSAAEMLQSLGAASSSWVPPKPSGSTSLIVLPFAASEGDQELATGVAAELISRLGRLPQLRVLGHSTSRNYSGGDPRKVGAELNVDMALEGRLRQSGGKVRLNASLTNTKDGFQVWSERFNTEAGDIFEMEDQLAAALVGALQDSAGDSFQNDAPAQPQKQGAAYAFYLKGVGQLAVAEGPNLDQGRENLEKAVELEPTLACAQAKLSQVYLFTGLVSPMSERSKVFTKARVAAEAALRCEPANADALVAMGTLDSNPQLPNQERARRFFREAAKAAPSHAEALSRLAYTNLLLGNCKAGIAVARAAINLDPVRIFPYGWLCLGLTNQGKFEQALDPIERALRVNSDSLMTKTLVLWCDILLGRLDRARGLAEHLAQAPYLPPAAKAILYVYRAAKGELTDQIPTLDSDNASTLIEAERLMADAMALLGQPQACFSYLNSAFGRGYRTVSSLDTDPMLESVRATPEFQEIRTKMMEAIAQDEEFEEPLLGVLQT